MPIEIPDNEPYKLGIGNTWKWTRSLPDYPASTWTLTYTLINASNKITIVAGADSDNHSVNVAMSATAAYTKGDYKWQAHVDDGTDRYLVDEGHIELFSDYSIPSTLDDRSHSKKVLDAIESVLVGRASIDQESITVEGKALSRTPIADLLILRDKAKSEYEKEIADDRTKNGLGHKGNIRVRF